MRHEIRNWWEQAKKDLRASEKNLGINEYYVSVFLSHQAVEKGLKAFCLKKLGEMPQTHSIIYLAKIMSAPSELMSGIRDLNPEYLITRYPDMAGGLPAENYDKEIADKHLETAKKVFLWLEKQIQE